MPSFGRPLTALSILFCLYGPTLAAETGEATPVDSTAAPVGRQSTFVSGGKPVGMELFEPKTRGPHPIVLLLHGARGLKKSEEALRAEAGLIVTHDDFAAAILHYFDRTVEESGPRKELFALWRKTIADALATLGQNKSLDTRKVGLVGFSLGAALALDFAAVDARVGAVVEFFGWLPEDRTADTLPPILILHGDRDNSVPVERAHELVRRLTLSHRPFEVRIFPGEGHGFGREATAEALTRMLEFLKKHLGNAGGASR
jgi:dienelactone hydrolase